MVIFFVFFYLLLNIGIGYWASLRVKSSQDFALANKSLALPLATTSVFATWFGAETLLGSSSKFVEKGVLGVIEDPFGASLCLMLIAVFFARPLYRLNLWTFNDYFRLRFGVFAERISAWLIIPSYFGWVAGQLVAMAVVLQVLMGIDMRLGIIGCTIVVVFYTYWGGMWAVSITDFAQTICIVIGLVVVSVILLLRVGGFEVMINQAPAGFFRFYPDFTVVSVGQYLASWMVIGLGSIPQQDMFQRVMSAKNERTAVMASFIGAGLYLTVALMPLVIALASKTLYPALFAQQKDAQLFLPSVIMAQMPEWVQIMFFGALLSAILSTASGAMLAPATVCSENILKPLLPKLTDAQHLQLLRVCVLIVGLFAMGLALLEGNIYELVSASSAISLVTLFVPLVFGLFGKWLNEQGAIGSMVLGMSVWIIAKILESQGIIPHLFPILIGLLGSIFGSVLGNYFGKKGK